MFSRNDLTDRRAAFAVGFLLLALATVRPALAGGDPCLAGHSGVGGIEPCDPCAVGEYQPDPGQDFCFPCDPGTYQDTTGQTSCKLCDPGTAQPSVGATSCDDCDPGTAQIASGQLFCEDCDLGEFQDDFGQLFCEPCPLGKFQDAEGQSLCKDCPLGFFQDQTGQSECEPCKIGTEGPAKGLSSCAFCDAGEAQTASGQQACEPCDSGTYAHSSTEADRLACDTCESNEDCATCVANETCDTCSVNQAGCSSCLALAAGCLTCEPGTAAGGTGSTECADCGLGRFNDGATPVDQSACDACGTNTDCAACQNIDRTQCFECPINTFADVEGSIACQDCENNRFTSATGASTCESCSEGTYRFQNATPAMDGCAACPAFGVQCTGGTVEVLDDFYVNFPDPPRAGGPVEINAFAADTVDGTLTAEVTVPASTPEAPATVVFGFELPLLPPRAEPDAIVASKDGADIDACSGAPGEADPDPCIDGRTRLGNGDVELTALTSTGGLFAFAIPARCSPHPVLLCGGGAKDVKLGVKDGKDGNTKKDKVDLKFARTGLAAPDALGDPLSATHYALCLYDASVVPAELVYHGRVPAGGVCDDKGCWKQSGSGFQYKDKEALSDGVTQIKLDSSGDGLKLQVKGKGDGLGLGLLPLALPAPLPLRAQIQAGNGECWEAEYSGDEVKKNDEKTFKAKGL